MFFALFNRISGFGISGKRDMVLDKSMKAAIYNHQCWIKETTPIILTETLENLLIQSGFSILNKITHHFSPQGFTAIWLLAESHFAIHTFPEENKTYLELSSCNEAMKDAFVELLEENDEILL